MKRRTILAALGAAALIAVPLAALAGNPVQGVGVSVETSPGGIVAAKGQTDAKGTLQLAIRSTGKYIVKIGPMQLVRGQSSSVVLTVVADGKIQEKKVPLPADGIVSAPFQARGGSNVTVSLAYS